MKVGSLVECVNNEAFSDMVKLKTFYTVREIYNTGDYVESIPKNLYQVKYPFIRIDEIIAQNVKMSHALLIDFPFPLKCFREIQPPIANIEAHINENTLTPETV